MFLLRVIVLTILFIPVIVLAELTDFYLEVDPKDGAVSDNYELNVVLEGPSADGSVAPHIKGGDFKASFIGPRSETMIVNGEVTRRMVFVYKIVPTKTGALTTPSATIEVEGSEYVANALAVNVSKTPANVSGVHFEQYVDNSEPYVGEQIVYSIEVATNASLFELRLDDTPFDSFWGEPFKDETRTSRQINGSRYAVSGTKRSLYPMKDGVLPLPERTLRAKMRERSSAQSPFGPFNPFDDGFLNPLGSRMVERTFIAEKREVRVKPLPVIPSEFKKDAFRFGIVGVTELASKLSSSHCNVGDPITYELTLKSMGNLRPVQIDLNLDPALKVYPEKPRVTAGLVDGKHVMEKVFAFSIVPKHPGNFTIPALSIGYFDPREAKYKVLTSEAAKFDVSGSSEAPQNDAVATPIQAAEIEQPASVQKDTAENTSTDQVATESNAISLWWGSALMVLGALIGWFLHGGNRPRVKTLLKASSLIDLDAAFVSELNTRLNLNPPASKWGLRAALMRELAENKRDVAADIIGTLDSIDHALYGTEKIKFEDLKAACLRCLRHKFSP